MVYAWLWRVSMLFIAFSSWWKTCAVVCSVCYFTSFLHFVDLTYWGTDSEIWNCCRNVCSPHGNLDCALGFNALVDWLSSVSREMTHYSVLTKNFNIGFWFLWDIFTFIDAFQSLLYCNLLWRNWWSWHYFSVVRLWIHQ